MKQKKQIFVLSVIFLLLLQNGIMGQEYAAYSTAKLVQQREYSTEKIKAGIWPPVDAEWFYTVKTWGACFPCYFSYQNTKVIGDTLILSKDCRILGKYNKPEICDNMGYDTEFIYEENNKVYWYNRTIEQFTLLYDFSATTGDSWEIFVSNCSLMLNVDSIGSLQLNNQDYKTLYVSDEDNYFTGKIIENIGHTTSMFPRDIYWYCNGVACDSDFINGLRCYLQNDTLVYKKDEIPCDTTYEIYTSINENKVQQIVIAPNPFNASISIYTINSSEFSADELHYNLYNITGALLKGGIIPQNGKLNLSDLKQGIYAIQLLLSNKTIHTQKIIKQ